MKLKRNLLSFFVLLCLTANSVTPAVFSSEPPQSLSGHTQKSGVSRKGDLNADGTIDGIDAVILTQYLAEWEIDFDLQAADVNNDGTVDGADVMLLLQYLAEWDVELGGGSHRKPVLSFVIDDLSPNDYRYRTYFTSRNIAPTIPVVTSYIKEYGSSVQNATLSQLLELQNVWGYEFGSHTLTHPRDLTEMSDEEIDYQLSESRNWMLRHGLECSNFFVPYGNYNEKILDAAAELYRATRTSDSRNPTINDAADLNLKNVHTVWLDAAYSGNDPVQIQTAVDLFCSYIDEALRIGENAWLVISFHTNSVSDFWMEHCFGAVADYAIAKELNILTFNKALTYFGVPEMELPPISIDTPPELRGIEDVTISAGSAFDPLSGVSAYDGQDGDLTGRIACSGTCDPSAPGIYTLIYSVTDTGGNTVTAKRIVTVTFPEEPDPLLRIIKDADGSILREDTLSADGSTVTRNVGVITFDGSADENWILYPKLNNSNTEYGEKTYTFRILLTDGNGVPLLQSNLSAASVNLYSKSISLKAMSLDSMTKDTYAKALPGIAATDVSELLGDDYISLPYIVVRVSGLVPANGNGLRNYLSENPLTIWYPLAEPVIERIN